MELWMMVTTCQEQRLCTSVMMATDWLDQASVSVNVTALGTEGLLFANVSISTFVQITKASSTDQNVK